MRERILVTAVCVGLVVVACSKGGSGASPGSGAPPSADGTSAGDVEASPFEVAIGEAAGYPYAVIREAVEAARADFVVECVRAEGWDITLSDPYFQIPEPPPLPRFGGSVAGFIARVESEADPGGGEVAGEGVIEDASAREQTVGECGMEAEKELPDPTAPLQRWLDEQAADLEAAVEADRRIVEARDRFPRCVAEGGYDYTSYDEAGNDFYDRAQRIYEEFRSGEVGSEDALARLRELEAEERAVGEVLNPCMEELLAVEREVRAEVEAAYLAEHGDEMAAAAAEVGDGIGAYEEYLAELTP